MVLGSRCHKEQHDNPTLITQAHSLRMVVAKIVLLLRVELERWQERIDHRSKERILLRHVGNELALAFHKR